ncbi:hypothetical protein J3E68DRAFT_396203 [Trichoderma sp. SZMC 28012]
MGEFELGAASLSWHCTVSGSESQPGGVQELWPRSRLLHLFSHPALQPEIKYRPTLWVRQTDEPV